MKRIAISFAVILLLGCAAHPPQNSQISPVDKAIEALSIQPCCAALRELRSLPLTKVGESVDFELGAPDRPLASTQGRAYARIMTLPDDQKTYHFMLESFSNQVGDLRQVFAPVVLILNEDYSLSRMSRLDMLRMDEEHMLWQERERMTIFISVNRQTSPREKYIVITTAPEAYRRFLDFRRIPTPNNPIYYVTRTSAEPISKFIFKPIQLGPEGVLRITNLSSAIRKPFEYWILF